LLSLSSTTPPSFCSVPEMHQWSTIITLHRRRGGGGRLARADPIAGPPQQQHHQRPFRAILHSSPSQYHSRGKRRTVGPFPDHEPGAPRADFCLRSWLPTKGQGRSKINIGSHLMKERDLTKRAGFLEDLTARAIQDLLLSAFRRPSKRRNFLDQSLPIRLQALSARSYNKSPNKPKPPPSAKPLEASHLCHNPSCFSPSHVILETKAANLTRNTCRSLRKLNVAGEADEHPCTHGDAGKGSPRCILPTTKAAIKVVKTVSGGVREMLKKDEERRGKGAMALEKVQGGKRKQGVEKAVDPVGEVKRLKRQVFVELIIPRCSHQ
jgi:hypothetical protein